MKYQEGEVEFEMIPKESVKESDDTNKCLLITAQPHKRPRAIMTERNRQEEGRDQGSKDEQTYRD